MLKTIKSKLRDRSIRFADRNAPLGGPLAENGGCMLYQNSTLFGELEQKISDFNDKLMQSEKLQSELRVSALGTGYVYEDVLLHLPEVAFLLDQDLLKIARDYIGPDLKLDAVYLSVVNTVAEQTEFVNPSSLQHHDSVGHRVKIFFPINRSGNTNSPTYYLAGSNKIKWPTYQNSASSSNDRLAQYGELVKNRSNGKNVVVPYGWGYIFDTNGIHSGVYKKDEEPRVMFQFELSARKNSYVRGQVGQARMHMAQSAKDYLEIQGLLRSEAVLEDNGVWKTRPRKNRRIYSLLDDIL